MCVTNPRGPRRAVPLSLYSALKGTGATATHAAVAGGGVPRYFRPTESTDNTNGRDCRHRVEASTVPTRTIITPNNAWGVLSHPALTSSFRDGGFSPSPSTGYHDAQNGTNYVPTPSALRTEEPRREDVGQEDTQADFPPKKRPRRRRKPQKPGLTAKNNQRHFVKHNYHDHANEEDTEDAPNAGHDADVEGAGCEEARKPRRGGVTIPFPLKLHQLLDQIESDGLGHVVSWAPHGRSFLIRDPKKFVGTVMPKYFRQTKLTSFQRQLNLYGFQRLTRGTDNGAYYHELFLRGKAFLTRRMVRVRVKGTKFKAASSPDDEPDFYKMAPVGPSAARSVTSASEEDELHKAASLPTSVSEEESIPEGKKPPAPYCGVPPTSPKHPSVVAIPSFEPLPPMGTRHPHCAGVPIQKWMPPPPAVLGNPAPRPAAVHDFPSPYQGTCSPIPPQPYPRDLAKSPKPIEISADNLSQLWDCLDPSTPTPVPPNLEGGTTSQSAVPAAFPGPWHQPPSAPSAVSTGTSRSTSSGSTTSASAQSLETAEYSTSPPALPECNVETLNDNRDSHGDVFDCIVNGLFDQPVEARPAAAKTPSQDFTETMSGFEGEWPPAPESEAARSTNMNEGATHHDHNPEMANFEAAVRGIKDDVDLGRLLEKLVES